jgi:signal transduction histidine kinase/DNA-binding response OmpR family regulator
VLREDFAVILLDVNMPGVDGFETASLIRKRKKSAHTPIIFLTAFTDEIRMAQGYASGAVDYLPTPVVPEVLKAKVRVFIELSQMRRRAALQAEEHALRTAAEDAAYRFEFLANASKILSRCPTESDIIQSLAQLPVPGLADVSAVWLPPVEAHPAKGRRAFADGQGNPCEEALALPPEWETPIQQVIENGDPQLLARRESYGDLPALETTLLLPLTIENKTGGVLLLGRIRSDAPYELSDMQLAAELAARGSVALEKAALLQRIREADKRKDEFLAMLAHELRNPLAPIANALEMLKRSPEPDLRGQAQETIERQLQHLVHLVDDLMDVSRITKGKIELRREPVRLRDMIAHAVETSQPLIGKHHHQLEVSPLEKDIWLHADASRISQIFSNLLNNAAKYTNDGGRIQLSVEAQDSSVKICVRDNGIGLSSDMLPKVFDLFSQADASLERTQGGLGIGLTLVKNLVEMHGGTISVRSDGLGRGCEFQVVLPVISPPEALCGEEKKAPAASSSPSTPLKVLIVDDNEASAKTMGWMLEIEGHEARLAHEGKKAIELAKAYRPNVILLDIGLPGMNGYDVCKALRHEAGLEKTVFVAQTGWGQEEHRRRSKEAGFDHHLVKPVNLVTLQQLFHNLTV